MLDICINHAARFDVTFNDKSQLIDFKSRNENVRGPDIYINGTKLKTVNSINYLSHILNYDIFYNDASKMCEILLCST